MALLQSGRKKTGLGGVIHAAQDDAAALVSQAVAKGSERVDRAVTKVFQPCEIEQKLVVASQLRCDQGKVTAKIASVRVRRFLRPLEANFGDAIFQLDGEMLKLRIFPRRVGRQGAWVAFGGERVAGFVVKVKNFEKSMAVFGQTWIPIQSEKVLPREKCLANGDQTSFFAWSQSA